MSCDSRPVQPLVTALPIARERHLHAVHDLQHQRTRVDRHLTDADCRRRLLQAPGVVTLMTERNMTVVTLDVVASAPPLDLAAGDHIAEASLELSAGRLCVQGLMDYDCEETPVAPGPYRVRLAGHGYATLSADGLEGDDRYDLTLWPTPMGEVAVLKQWEGCKASR